MFKIGVVGCGIIGNRLARAFISHKETEIVACTDINRLKADEFASQYNCKAFYDYKTMIDQTPMDIVYVGVPPLFHKEVTLYAFENGKQVICEKPIAATTMDGLEMTRAANGITAINLPFRYTPGFRQMKQMLQSGELGEVQLVRLVFRFPQWPRAWQDVEWLRDRNQGGPLREVGTHFLFGLLELFGKVDRINAIVEFIAEGKCEKNAIVMMKAGDIPISLDLAIETSDPEENTITIVGSNRTVSLVGWFQLIENFRTEKEKVLNKERLDTTLELVDDYVSSIKGGPSNLVTFQEALEAQKLLEAIFNSHGQWEQIS